MKTLVYFGSGQHRKVYQKLPFDKIYLIDNYFKNRNGKVINTKGKITCLGMDCLESVKFLNNEGVYIDCFVSLNEGLYEGGGSYAINSDMFLGYAMPLFKNEYLHIMNKKYYHNLHNVSMDLPYTKKEIQPEDNDYINPYIFSKKNYNTDYAKVFKMRKDRTGLSKTLNNGLCLKIIHDSIWNYFDNIEKVIISFSNQGQNDFFSKIPNVININETSFDDILQICVDEQIESIGFTPWTGGCYNLIIEKLDNLTQGYPKEISLFHLNKNDYMELKKVFR